MVITDILDFMKKTWKKLTAGIVRQTQQKQKLRKEQREFARIGHLKTFVSKVFAARLIAIIFSLSLIFVFGFVPVRQFA